MAIRPDRDDENLDMAESTINMRLKQFNKQTNSKINKVNTLLPYGFKFAPNSPGLD
jgi:hypothetical protein